MAASFICGRRDRELSIAQGRNIEAGSKMTHRLKPSQYAVLVTIMLTASVGDSLLKRGMEEYTRPPFMRVRGHGMGFRGRMSAALRRESNGENAPHA